MRSARGFSLVEVMVVLVILGLTVTLTTLGFQRLENDRLEKQAGQLSAWLQGISDNAVLDGAVYGVSLTDQDHLEVSFFYDYRWWDLAGDDWRPLELEDDSALYLSDGKAWKRLNIATEEDPEPQVLFFPTGMSVPESLQLRDENRVATIERDADGLYNWSVQ